MAKVALARLIFCVAAVNALGPVHEYVYGPVPVGVLLSASVAPAQAVVAPAIVTVGTVAIVIFCVIESLQVERPLLTETTNFTGKVPEVVNVLAGFATIEVVPSPKLHAYVIVPMPTDEVEVNVFALHVPAEVNAAVGQHPQVCVVEKLAEVIAKSDIVRFTTAEKAAVTSATVGV
jgi:hypothetical protein